jgi:hypothetical protein
MQKYNAKVQCKNTMQKYNAKIQCKNTMQKYNAKIQCRILYYIKIEINIIEIISCIFCIL